MVDTLSQNDRKRQVRRIDTLFDKTLELLALYRSLSMPEPFALKGNLGELLVQKELIRQFPKQEIVHVGGSHPGYDLSIGKVRIQVKTQIKLPPKKYKHGKLDFESSPTIRKTIIDDKKCDVLILAILYPNHQFSRIDKANIYVFDKDDFKYFKTNFCWSGKSKGDYTILNVINIEGKLPPKAKEAVTVYDKPEYKKLFRDSKEDWIKIKKAIDSAEIST